MPLQTYKLMGTFKCMRVDYLRYMFKRINMFSADVREKKMD